MTRRGKIGLWALAVLLVIGIAALAVGGYIHWQDTHYPSQAELAQVSLPPEVELIERGRYLARAANCFSCHTAEGGAPLAGGVSFGTPFGTLYAPNITPDEETGIGRWSDADFVRAMHRGVGPGGKRLYPAFPYNYYTLMSTEEVLAIKAYLFSLEPVRNQVQENELSFPFNLRFILTYWNLLFLDERRFDPDPTQDDEWNRGAYLVRGPGHCGACHTARNIFQAPGRHRLGGETTDGWHAYNITPDPHSGIGNWSDDELLQYLHTGIAGERAFASGPMAEVIEDGTQHLTAEDLAAMVRYLRTVEPVAGDEERARDSWGNPADDIVAIRGRPHSERVSGAELYIANCATCHAADGSGASSGQPGGYPRLYRNADIGSRNTSNLIKVILDGVERETQEAHVFMPGFATQLDDEQIAALANYLIEQFGNPDAAGVRADDVAELRETGH